MADAQGCDAAGCDRHFYAPVDDALPLPPPLGAPADNGDDTSSAAAPAAACAAVGPAAGGGAASSTAAAAAAAAALEARLAGVRRDVVGGALRVATPFGTRALCYADWSASGRGLATVERCLGGAVLPLYGNTHSTATATGMQSTCFLAEARASVAASLGARCQYDGSGDGGDVVLFCGSGATACCAKLVQLLGLHQPWRDRDDDDVASASRRPVVLVGPWEHHSNLLPWRESCARVVQLPENPAGTGVCRTALATALGGATDACLVLGCFSAASNVTGCCEDVASLAAQLHAAGALAVFDYAGASGGMHMCMNPPPPPGSTAPIPLTAADVAADALFLSPHKLPGGPGSPGVLVVKRSLLRRAVPSTPGGGTVFFVDREGHSYVSNPVDREQGGTPDVLGTCRAALALRTRRSAEGGPATSHAPGLPCSSQVAARAHALAVALDAGLRRHPNVCVLGPPVVPLHDMPSSSQSVSLRLPVSSFLIRGPGRRWLHPGFVSSLLNDLFGVQARPGCACAGPHGLRMLGAEHAAAALETALRRKTASPWGEGLRPGWTRVSFSYCCSVEEVRYAVDAVCAVASQGWALLPQYRLDPVCGEWRHVSFGGAAGRMPHRRWLAHTPLPWDDDVAYGGRDTGGDAASTCAHDDGDVSAVYAQQLAASEAVFLAAANHHEVNALAPPAGGSDGIQVVSDDHALRWFVLPTEAAVLLRRERAEGQAAAQDVDAEWVPLGPIQPKRYLSATGHDIATPQQPQCAVEPLRSGSSATSGLRARREADSCEPQFADPLALAALRPATPALVAATAAIMSADRYPSHSDCSDNDDDDDDCGGNDDNVVISGSNTGVARPPPPVGVVPPPRKLLANVARTVARFDMIRPGDNILVGLSGGKDSLTLLHTLLHMRARSPVRFTLGVATVDPGAEGFDPSALGPYVKSLGVPFHMLGNHIMDDAASGSLQGDSICAFCARMKRGALYSCCKANGYNVLALGQHADDVAESALMSAFHNGALRTMKACYVSGSHGVRVIRPLVAVRERATRDFAYGAGLPVIADNCPACFEAPKQRRRVKQLLKREETAFPQCVANLSAALLPLLDPRAQAMLRAIRTELDAKQKDNTKHGAKQRPQHVLDVDDACGGHHNADADGRARSALAAVSDDALLAELVARGGCGVTGAQVAATLGADEAAEDASEAAAASCGLRPRA